MAPGGDSVPDAGYVELHCHSNFSFLDGASHVEELVLRARELGYPALALTDHNGLHGAMEFAQVARAWGIQPITGAEVTLATGHHLTLLAATRQGYGNLCRILSRAHLDNERGQPHVDPTLFEHHASGLIALSGCRLGEIPALLMDGKAQEARAAVERFLNWFGEQNFFIEIQRNRVADDLERGRALIRLARELGLPLVATNNVHYHIRQRSRLQDVLVAIRNRTTLEQSHQLRRPNSEYFLKSAESMAQLFADIPEAIDQTITIAERCQFDLTTDLNYRFPSYREAQDLQHAAREDVVPTTSSRAMVVDANELLQKLCQKALRERYAKEEWPAAEERLTEELRLIAFHKLAGFFLIYRDILQLGIEIARELYGPQRNRPPGRGRGSSTGSIVCYLIGLSPIDPLRNNLFLGRFLNEEMATVPDIDLDFAREVRERLILKIYQHYGPEHVALVCSFPTYRLRSAVRDIGKVLGLPQAELGRLAKLAGSHGAVDKLAEEMARYPEFNGKRDAPLWRDLIDLAAQIKGFPRHTSQHVGGMIISTDPIVEIVPLEQSAMEGRVIAQWDKDSVDDARMIKIDFLALGMLSLVDYCLDEIRNHRGEDIDISRIDYDDPKVYDMICEADTIGVFQIESRAQTQTLPRTKPRNLDDLTVEVAIIRPGPVVGGAVNPYIARRQGREPVSYDHSSLEPVLEETLGVILFQEQVLQVAMTIAGYSPGKADRLRRAMSRKRSREAFEEEREEFLERSRKRGVNLTTAKTIFDKLAGFAEFGFPKSHAAAFALLAYQSSWLKHYYPVEFACSLLNAQPMGFYSTEVIVRAFQHRGVRFAQPDIQRSRWRCTVEDGTVRIGLRYVKGVGEQTGRAIEQARDRDGPFRSLRDFLWRSGTRRGATENLIRAGAFDSIGLNRRELLWQLGLVYRPPSQQLPLPLSTNQDQVQLADLDRWERVAIEYEVLGFSTVDHPMSIIRRDLPPEIMTSADITMVEDGIEVVFAGMVVCRQRPETAGGFTFITLEDERGLANLIVRPKILEQYRSLIRGEPFLNVRGKLQIRDGTTNIIIKEVEPLPIPPGITAPPAHNYR